MEQSISSSFIFSLHSSFHLLCAAVSLPPASSPVPPACLRALGSFVRVPSLLPGEGSTGGALSQAAPPGLFLLLVIASAARPCVTGAPAAQTKRERRSPSRQGASSARLGTNTHSPAGPRPPGTSGAAQSEQHQPEAMAALYTSPRKHMAKAKSHNIFIS